MTPHVENYPFCATHQTNHPYSTAECRPTLRPPMNKELEAQIGAILGAYMNDQFHANGQGAVYAADRKAIAAVLALFSAHDQAVREALEVAIGEDETCDDSSSHVCSAMLENNIRSVLRAALNEVLGEKK